MKLKICCVVYRIDYLETPRIRKGNWRNSVSKSLQQIILSSNLVLLNWWWWGAGGTRHNILETAFLLFSLNQRRFSGNTFNGISQEKASAFMFTNIFRFYLLEVNIFHFRLTEINLIYSQILLNMHSFQSTHYLMTFSK